MANCVHGFPQEQCLICQTLGGRQANAPDASRVQAAERPNVLLRDEGPRPLPARAQGGAALGQVDRGGRRRRRSSKATVVTALAAIVVGGLLIWAFAGIFELAFHIFEYVVVAIVAGWAGYKIGHAVGRREHQRERRER